MKKICLLAIAGLFAVSTIHTNATLVREKFATDPALNGWQAFGNTNLFQWDSTNQVLDVTWDSTQTNSYYYLPLGQTYTIADGFCVRFDLQLADAVAFNSGSELAVGLFHLSDAINPNFSRAGLSPNVCEFDYFPTYVYQGQQYPASEDATFIDAANNFYFAYDNLTLNPGVTYRIWIIHEPGAGTITGQIFTNGQPVSLMPFTYGVGDGDFQLDSLSISSYSDDGFGDTILAHGSVGNLVFASPLPIGLIHAPAPGQLKFGSDTNWFYTLEQTCDLQAWTAVAPVVFGTGTNLLLQATNPPSGHAFYRVEADLP